MLALGKFGGRELAEGADLDLMLVYDAPGEAANASEFYTRMTQRLISALSAPTEEGSLYDIDAKLRPSGSKGPVAVRLSSFERYYAEEAWTWELQALTRLRPVAGDAALSARVAAIARATLAQPRDAQKVFADVAEMRGRMERERGAKSEWDLKLAPGGFVDVEFIAQALQLAHAAEAPEALSPNTGEALARLARAGKLDAAVCARLRAGWRLWSDLQHMLRICIGGEFNPLDAPPPLPPRLAALSGDPDFEALDAKVRAVQAAIRADFIAIIGPLGDGKQPLRR